MAGKRRLALVPDVTLPRPGEKPVRVLVSCTVEPGSMTLPSQALKRTSWGILGSVSCCPLLPRPSLTKGETCAVTL